MKVVSIRKNPQWAETAKAYCEEKWSDVYGALALVAVYFVNIYIFQNYKIPSSSLEKSLLVGDFLYVSKMSYGQIGRAHV